MASLNSGAKDYLRTLKAIVQEQGRVSGATLPGAPRRTGRGGVDRATELELRQILRNTGEILGALRPSAAEERSLLL